MREEGGGLGGWNMEQTEEIGRVGTVELTALFGGWLGECVL